MTMYMLTYAPRFVPHGLFALALIGFATNGNAQEEQEGSVVLEEILVTATKTGEVALQDTAASITALNADDVSRSLIVDQRDLTQLVPNLFVTENSTLAQIFIRGVGTNAVFAGADPSSTIHLDGVYVGRPAASFSNFLDVERIEVLRGPQGTLYGRNSAGGTINIISRRPGDEFESSLQATAGNYGTFRLEGYASGPLADGVSASLSASHSSRDGYREMILPEAEVDEVDDQNTQAVRGQLRFTPNERAEVMLRADYATYDQTAFGFDKVLVFPSITPVVNSVYGDYKKLPDNGPSEYERDNWGLSLEANLEFGDGLNLRSLTAYRKNDVFLRADTDNSDLSLFVTNVHDVADSFSQEFNLVGVTDRLSWLVGAFYYDESNDSNLWIEFFTTGISPNFFPVVNITSWALFAQATYDITERLALTLGARYLDEEKEFNQNFRVNLLATGATIVGPFIFTSELNDDAVTPKVGLDFRLSDEVLLYASYTQGYKSGGFNFNISAPRLPDGSLRAFGPEEIEAWEIGLKGEFLDNRLRVNSAAFYYDYTDLQVQSFIVPGVIDITNAADAEVTGMELEMLARPSPELTLSAALAWLDAEYKSYPEAQITGGSFINASGNRLNSAPESSVSLAAQYDFPLSGGGAIFVRGEYNWQDDVFFTADNNDIETQDSFALLNLSIGYRPANGNWRAAFWAKNVTDEEYVTGTAGFPAAGISGLPGPPATYGLQFVWKSQGR